MSEQQTNNDNNQEEGQLDFDTCKPFIIDGFNSIPFNHTLGLKLDHIAPDEIRTSFTMKPELIGNTIQQILHGGVIASVLDATGGAMASAVVMSTINTIDPADLEAFFASVGKMGTVGLHVDYLRPGRGDTFISTAKVLRAGSKVIAISVELHNDSNELIAVAGGNFIYPGFK